MQELKCDRNIAVELHVGGGCAKDTSGDVNSSPLWFL